MSKPIGYVVRPGIDGAVIDAKTLGVLLDTLAKQPRGYYSVEPVVAAPEPTEADKP